MTIFLGVITGLIGWFLVRFIVTGLFTVDQNERAVKTSFGRAQRLPGSPTTLEDPVSAGFDPRNAIATPIPRSG